MYVAELSSLPTTQESVHYSTIPFYKLLYLETMGLIFMLLGEGTDANAQGGEYGSTLHAAS
jgi:hypothetical protein